jgi:predicted CXXCH cytochrome family protein
MKKNTLQITVACCIAVMVFTLAITRSLHGATIVSSKHDFSTAGTNTNEVCVFCHTPHSANPLTDAPLWNRFVDTSKVFTVYSSPTMDTSPGNPAVSVSALCLGCHDGSSAYGIVVPTLGVTGGDKHDLVSFAVKDPSKTDQTSYQPCEKCHGDIWYGTPRWFRVGTDLSNDHPITMTYPTSAQDPAFNTPPDLQNGWTDIKLFRGRVECPSCHNAHDPANAPFLRKSNTGGALCVTCHIK